MGEVGEVGRFEGGFLAAVGGSLREGDGGVGAGAEGGGGGGSGGGAVGGIVVGVVVGVIASVGVVVGVVASVCVSRVVVAGSVVIGVSIVVVVGVTSVTAPLEVASQVISCVVCISVSSIRRAIASRTVSSSGSSSTLSSSQGLSLAQVIDAKAESVDAAIVISVIIAGVTLGSWVANLAWCKGASLVGKGRVTANGGDLGGELLSNLLVQGSSSVGSGVLVLLEGSDLRVHGLDRSAGDRLQSDGSSVAFQGAVDESEGHAFYISGCLGIGESLVSSGLLEAVYGSQ